MGVKLIFFFTLPSFNVHSSFALSASLEETYENQLNKHICAQSSGKAEWASHWGNQSGLQSPETALPSTWELQNITPSGSRVDEGLNLRHELGASQGHRSNTQSLVFCFGWHLVARA